VKSTVKGCWSWLLIATLFKHLGFLVCFLQAMKILSKRRLLKKAGFYSMLLLTRFISLFLSRVVFGCLYFIYAQFRCTRGGSRKKYWGGPGPSSFGRQQRLSEITIEPITSTIEPGPSRATAGPGKAFSRGPIAISFRLKHPANFRPGKLPTPFP